MDVESVCTAAGGQFVDYTFSITCAVTFNDTTTDVTYDFKGIPDCIGESCDPTAYEGNLTNTIADTLDNITDINNCNVAGTSPAPTIRGAKAFLVITGALLASTFLF
jgi:hypothetical protein